MANILQHFKILFVLAISFLIGRFALGQSDACQQAYTDNTQACYKAMQGASGTNNSMVGVVQAQATGGGYNPANPTSLAGSASAANLTTAQNYCDDRLNDCVNACADDPQVQQQCKDIITTMTGQSARAIASNTTVASSASSINAASNSDYYNDQPIPQDQAANAPVGAQVQQTGLLSAAAAACKIGAILANCYLSPMQQPSISDLGSKPVIQQVMPNQQTMGGN